MASGSPSPLATGHKIGRLDDWTAAKKWWRNHFMFSHPLEVNIPKITEKTFFLRSCELYRVLPHFSLIYLAKALS